MNYRDLQNISNLSQEILIEGANEEHNVLNRWPYTSPYLQESTELDEGAAGNVAARAQKLANQRKDQTPERKKIYQDLAYKARARQRTQDNPGDLVGASRFERSKAYGPQITPASSQRASETETIGGGTYERGPKRKPKGKKYERQVQSGVRAASSQEKKRLGIKEDIYDIILSHLLDEGYAETQEQAEVIMVNMSEDWRESIVEQASTVASSGGAGGKVTADKQYPATLRGLKGVKSTDSKGTEYFQPYTSSGRREPSGKPFEPTTMPDANRAQYKQSYSGKYENIPASQSTKNPQSHLFRTGVPRVRSATSTYGID